MNKDNGKLEKEDYFFFFVVLSNMTLDKKNLRKLNKP